MNEFDAKVNKEALCEVETRFKGERFKVDQTILSEW